VNVVGHKDNFNLEVGRTQMFVIDLVWVKNKAVVLELDDWLKEIWNLDCHYH